MARSGTVIFSTNAVQTAFGNEDSDTGALRLIILLGDVQNVCSDNVGNIC